MPSVSVTRLRLRSRRFIPVFFYYTWAVVRQARRSPGFLQGLLFIGADRLPPAAVLYGRQPGYWTATMWRDRQAMLAFRDRASHREAMRKGAEWVQEASVVGWQQEAEQLPSLSEAHDRMVEDGQLMPAHQPSEAHASGRIPEEPGLQPFVTLRPVEDD